MILQQLSASCYVMRGLARIVFAAFLFSLLLLYQHRLQTNLLSPCSDGLSREALSSFVLPDNVTLASLNTTGRAEVDILFFNRVPKVKLVSGLASIFENWI